MNRRRGLQAIAAAGFALAWAGLLCRGRDGGVVSAVLYYATPWLPRLLAGLLALAVFRHWGLRAMAATCIGVSLLEGWHSFRLDELPAAPAGAPVVSVWNAGRALDRKPSAWPALAGADVAAVIECGTFSDDEWRRFTAASPHHDWRRFDGSTMLGVRGRILSHEPLGVHDLFRCHRVRVALPEQGELTVVVADVRSQPWISRERALAAILRAAGDDPRALILGDFNTPPESVWFREWRNQGFSLANDGPRRGFRETWAYGLPLWTLDHVWVGRGWHTRRAGHSWHGSDHARVEVVLSP